MTDGDCYYCSDIFSLNSFTSCYFRTSYLKSAGDLLGYSHLPTNLPCFSAIFEKIVLIKMEAICCWIFAEGVAFFLISLIFLIYLIGESLYLSWYPVMALSLCCWDGNNECAAFLVYLKSLCNWNNFSFTKFASIRALSKLFILFYRGKSVF